jgi:hypothetical protein
MSSASSFMITFLFGLSLSPEIEILDLIEAVSFGLGGAEAFIAFFDSFMSLAPS